MALSRLFDGTDSRPAASLRLTAIVSLAEQIIVNVSKHSANTTIIYNAELFYRTREQRLHSPTRPSRRTPQPSEVPQSRSRASLQRFVSELGLEDPVSTSIANNGVRQSRSTFRTFTPAELLISRRLNEPGSVRPLTARARVNQAQELDSSFSPLPVATGPTLQQAMCRRLVSASAPNVLMADTAADLGTVRMVAEHKTAAKVLGGRLSSGGLVGTLPRIMAMEVARQCFRYDDHDSQETIEESFLSRDTLPEIAPQEATQSQRMKFSQTAAFATPRKDITISPLHSSRLSAGRTNATTSRRTLVRVEPAEGHSHPRAKTPLLSSPPTRNLRKGTRSVSITGAGSRCGLWDPPVGMYVYSSEHGSNVPESTSQGEISSKTSPLKPDDNSMPPSSFMGTTGDSKSDLSVILKPGTRRHAIRLFGYAIS